MAVQAEVLIMSMDALKLISSHARNLMSLEQIHIGLFVNIDSAMTFPVLQHRSISNVKVLATLPTCNHPLVCSHPLHGQQLLT